MVLKSLATTYKKILMQVQKKSDRARLRRLLVLFLKLTWHILQLQQAKKVTTILIDNIFLEKGAEVA